MDGESIADERWQNPRNSRLVVLLSASHLSAAIHETLFYIFSVTSQPPSRDDAYELLLLMLGPRSLSALRVCPLQVTSSGGCCPGCIFVVLAGGVLAIARYKTYGNVAVKDPGSKAPTQAISSRRHLLHATRMRVDSRCLCYRLEQVSQVNQPVRSTVVFEFVSSHSLSSNFCSILKPFV